MRTLNIIGALMAMIGTAMLMGVADSHKFGLAEVAAGGLFLGGLFLFIFARIFQKE